jgi:hypothetical protein
MAKIIMVEDCWVNGICNPSCWTPNPDFLREKKHKKDGPIGNWFTPPLRGSQGYYESFLLRGA